MKNIYLKIVLGLVIVLFSSALSAQENNNDFESWTSAAIEYSPSKKWNFGLEGQYRLKENSSVTDGYFFELTAERELFKNFALALGGRYIKKNDNKGKIQGWESYLRLHVDASYKIKFDDLNFKIRMRYQNRDELGIEDEFGNFADHYLRLKGSFTYKIKSIGLTPMISGEIFHHNEGEVSQFNKYRLTAGASYKLGNAGKIGLYYRAEKQLNVEIPQTVDILRIKYVYSIKNR